MNKNRWEGPKFVKSAVTAEGYPQLKDDQGRLLPEIAIAGRSNVGKSSLINHLFRSPGLARTSSRPGKTQLINFFVLGSSISFVDLPGYGYAEVPLSVRKEWGPMIQDYLQTRTQLQLLLFLFDVRRKPTEEDLQLMEWIAHAEKGVILVLTKVDKLSQSQVVSQTRQILEQFAVPNLHYVHYSVPKNRGRDSLLRLVNDAFQEEAK